MKKHTLAFTLVELVIVIVILGVLSSIGFVSYSNYIAGSRDANRISQVKDIYKGLQLYSTNKLLPLPDESVTITASGSVVGYQGYAGAKILQQINYTSGGKDPKDNQYFTYFVSKNKKSLQVLAFLEERENLETEVAQSNSPNPTRLFSQTYAATDYSNRYPKSFGSKLGVILQENTNTPIQDIVSGELDVVTSGDNYTAIFNDNDTLTGSGTTFNYLKSNFDCQRIQQLGGSRGSGIYTINPTGNNSLEVFCDMEIDDGGWTRVIFVNNGDTLWNAWDSDESMINSSGNQKFGIRIDQFSNDINGENIEYMIAVDGEQKGPIYTDVNYQAWDNFATSFFDDAFSFKSINDSQYTLCQNGSGIQHANTSWNWSIARSAGSECDQYSFGGGFLLFGSSERAETLYGLNEYDADDTWERLEVYIR